MIKETPFYKFLIDSIDKGGFSNDDVVAVMIPLLEEINEFHAEGKVAPLHKVESLLITNEKLDIDEKQILSPILNLGVIHKLFPDRGKVFEITGIQKQSVEVGEFHKTEISDMTIARKQDEINVPVYLTNYRSYEIELGHHDAVTDIFILGMITASLALHLDFTDEEDLEEFVRNRDSMIFLNQRIHPAIANIILGMTELDRNKRWKDLQEIIDNLKNYRDYNPENEMDLAAVVSQQKIENQNRHQVIHSRLRNRLFDTSRRNRLLYFKPNLKFINLTVSSVPNVLNYKNIDPETLFFWNNDMSAKFSSGKDISLSKYLRFEDNPYLGPSLDRIRLEAGKDINEYGFSQLRLSICFLHWYNLKEQLTEKISSPLLLVPVSLVKKKGVKDQFILQINNNEAEINPVLANMLKDLYDIQLPETVILNEGVMEELFGNLKSQIEKTRSGIVLDYVSKPRIKLIHALAKQTLSQYKRRISRSRKMQSLFNLDYSYDNSNFQPLGLQIFRNYIRPEHSSLEFLIDKDIRLSPSNFTEDNPNKSATRELFTLDDGNINPFKWEMDVCNIVLGNFNYKKMSLVRDYNTIIEDKLNNPVVDLLFNEHPKKNQDSKYDSLSIDEQYAIVKSDTTQMRAVQFARKNESYIIQGPPGTGKSQTITNLIADYVARGKKVLFVCEKRAAIDVVYHRLQQQQLDELCCLIHDSQSDKKEFILNLKSTHEKYINHSLSVAEAEVKRSVLIAKMNSELNIIRDFHFMMNNQLEESKTKVRELMEILISSNEEMRNFKKNDLDIPGYSQWLSYGETLKKLSSTTTEYTGQPYFSRHPFRHLTQIISDHDVSPNVLKENLSRATELMDEISERLELIDIPTDFTECIDKVKLFLAQSEQLIPFIEKDRIELLESKSELTKKLIDAVRHLKDLEKKINEAESKNEFWVQKLSKTDTDNALEILKKYEGSFFSFLNSSYRKTKKVIQQSYDLKKHQIKPVLSQVVTHLKAEHEIKDIYLNEKQKQEDYFRFNDLTELQQSLSQLREVTLPQVVQYMKSESANETTISEIKSLNHLFEDFYLLLQSNIRFTPQSDFKELEKIIGEITSQVKNLQAFSPLLKELKFAQESLKKLIIGFDVEPENIKVLLAQSSIDQFFARNRHLEKMEGIRLHYHIEQIQSLYLELLEVNSLCIRAWQQNVFLEMIKKSEMSVAGKREREKEEKKSLMEGRKILENEFGKSMRFKSIRELATGESGQIIRELKPVWLMSPLSVSDTLPMRNDYFDVVIFDEASQITLEEGLPPVYRASQIIIVGDEMQMPPSNFFSSSSSDPDDFSESDEDEMKFIALDADSFLTQGARKLPSIMLGWHYRSKHESLISFSNASFYKNQLLTIPDSVDHQGNRSPIEATNKEQAKTFTDTLMTQPISYHYLKFGVYESRANTAEAEYIAEMIRELLNRKTGLSIGVVAFSMEQQGEIENAVQRLAEEDSEFDKKLEEEYKRMDDGQFNGLFFKNLENVQGDERDIIIMSTCYGYDPKNKMIMNFGPINRRGGERRLNVIFSRAKKHMCVVSSIHYHDIKNEYNEGANYFRKYLQYAELASIGNMEMAAAVLQSISGLKSETHLTSISIVTEQLKKILEEKGYYVRTGIGQSHFKCHLGIKRHPEDKQYCVGILLDDVNHYENNDIMEQYVFKPQIMRATGWKVIQIYSKDWYDDQEKVLKRVMALLNNEPIEWVPMTTIAPIEIPKVEKTFQQETLVTEKPEMVSENISVNESSSNSIRLINIEDGSSKFWEVSAQGNEILIQYGKMNTKGQKLTKSFDTPEAAEREMQKLIKQKMAKGYKREE